MGGLRLSGAIAVVAWVLCGCHGVRPGSADAGSTDAASKDAAVGDAEAGAPAVTAAALVEAGPPDDAIPPSSSDELTERARHLLEAIGKDEADLANDILFPRDAWLATRDAGDPGKDWDTHAATPFRKAVHALSRHHHDLDRAQFASLEVGHALAQATTRRHGWKKALWVVHGSRLSFVVDGRTHTLPIREMTAWRGAWYVTRLR
jgi:hypothetical protein